jgi:hypothetical protein
MRRRRFRRSFRSRRRGYFGRRRVYRVSRNRFRRRLGFRS